MSNTVSASTASDDTSDSPSRREFLRRSAALGLAGIGAGSLVAACGGSGGDSGSAASGENESASQTSDGGSSGTVDKTVTIHPKGNEMKYKETEFKVAPGQKIELVFENTATSPSMQHNVVVLNTPPKEKFFRKVGEAGTKAGSANEYVPQDMDIVHAYTPMSKPGETVSVTFTTPEETGDYGYVCTFPGHWATMHGTMHVEKKGA